MSTLENISNAEDVLAIGGDRDIEIIRGVARDRGPCLRGASHSRSVANISFYLETWRIRQGYVQGEILVSGAFRLQKRPETSVGPDVAYSESSRCDWHDVIEGPPVLAVEMMSPSDTQADIHDKIVLYLETGTKLVWYVEPVRKKVFVYRPDGTDKVLSESDELDGGKHLPGFKVRVGELFE